MNIRENDQIMDGRNTILTPKCFRSSCLLLETFLILSHDDDNERTNEKMNERKKERGKLHERNERRTQREDKRDFSLWTVSTKLDLSNSSGRSSSSIMDLLDLSLLSSDFTFANKIDTKDSDFKFHEEVAEASSRLCRSKFHFSSNRQKSFRALARHSRT